MIRVGVMVRIGVGVRSRIRVGLEWVKMVSSGGVLPLTKAGCIIIGGEWGLGGKQNWLTLSLHTFNPSPPPFF